MSHRIKEEQTEYLTGPFPLYISLISSTVSFGVLILIFLHIWIYKYSLIEFLKIPWLCLLNHNSVYWISSLIKDIHHHFVLYESTLVLDEQ